MIKAFSYLTDVGRKFLRSSSINKKHIVLVVSYSAFIRFAQLFLPFRIMSFCMGEYRGKLELCTVVTQQQLYRAHKTGRFIENVCNRTPWKSECLVKVVILAKYLNQFGIPYVLHTGLAKGRDQSVKPLLAHAWIVVGGITIIGGDEQLRHPKGFVVLSTHISKLLKSYIPT